MDKIVHHTIVSCTEQDSGIWTIVNSEADKSMTFTTNHGHSGSIGPGGSTTVNWDGNELTVSAVWDNGFTATNSGEGSCQVSTTTTSPSSTSSSSTTLPVESTIPESTNTIPNSSESSTSSIPVASTVQEMIPPVSFESSPNTTLVEIPFNVVQASTTSVSQHSNSLPATGSETLPIGIIGTLLIAVGCVAMRFRRG